MAEEVQHVPAPLTHAKALAIHYRELNAEGVPEDLAVELVKIAATNFTDGLIVKEEVQQ